MFTDVLIRHLFLKLFYWITSYRQLLTFAFSLPHDDHDSASTCTSLARNLDLSEFNATILGSTYHGSDSAPDVPTFGSCGNPAENSISLCRVQLIVNTSRISSISAEAWLPSNWTGRFLALGNGGFEGCIKYGNLAYGSSLGFATIGTNNGHDGDTGEFFLNNTEVLADFTNRSIPIAAVLGKRITKAYYGRAHTKSYFLGCSMGGRQGIHAALHRPADFDGILAGAPAVNMLRLAGWSGMITRYLGAPHPKRSASHIPSQMWDIISAEVRRQCDKLDGVEDGIISDPDACDFRPEELRCNDDNTFGCLTVAQIEALRKVYEPLYGLNGELLIPRLDPGAEISELGREMILSGEPYLYLDHWLKYVVHSNPSYDYENVGLDDIYNAVKQDPGQINTYDGDLFAFRSRGGKIISYHGYEDEFISSGNSKDYYNLVSRTLGLNARRMDNFYRLFFAPGLGHCYGGHGATRFGQHAFSIPPSNASSINLGGDRKADNLLMMLVNWVERGEAPDTVTGVSDDGNYFREHCRYPQKSIWKGSKYVCT